MPHAGHCVDIHCRMHAGHIPPVSNVFHKCPQLHAQRAFASGDQAHNGQRMRGPAILPVASATSTSASRSTPPGTLRTIMPPAVQACFLGII